MEEEATARKCVGACESEELEWGGHRGHLLSAWWLVRERRDMKQASANGYHKLQFHLAWLLALKLARPTLHGTLE